MEFRIDFPGGLRVDAHLGSAVIPTDQPIAEGGEGAAPSPYALFLASLGTCAGFYVLRFCRSRGIPTEGMFLTQTVEADPISHGLARVAIEVRLPPGFPEKYREAVVRAADQCAVKRTLLEPPEIEVRAV